MLTVLWLAVTFSSCAPQQKVIEPEAPREDAGQPPPAGESVRPQQAAARELTARGRRQLELLQPDAAIRDLERALSLDPGDGQTYYYLAEAWLMKIDARRADEFNRMAETLLKDDPAWLLRIARQADRIAELEK
ncbi:MAG: hypothetical protein AMJ54_12840 [Deltaproteobacteria bacterium SG8_13]|nr:MAG: hypothetical protein AMJ54_12840 [Deltaproteobacteria bacterium SG8_13]